MFESNFPVDKISWARACCGNALKRMAGKASAAEKGAPVFGPTDERGSTKWTWPRTAVIPSAARTFEATAKCPRPRGLGMTRVRNAAEVRYRLVGGNHASSLSLDRCRHSPPLLPRESPRRDVKVVCFRRERSSIRASAAPTSRATTPTDYTTRCRHRREAAGRAADGSTAGRPVPRPTGHSSCATGGMADARRVTSEDWRASLKRWAARRFRGPKLACRSRLHKKKKKKGRRPKTFPDLLKEKFRASSSRQSASRRWSFPS